MVYGGKDLTRSVQGYFIDAVDLKTGKCNFHLKLDPKEILNCMAFPQLTYGWTEERLDLPVYR